MFPILVVQLLCTAIWGLPSPDTSRAARLDVTRALDDFLTAHFAILAPILLAACVLLYLRNQRAFRWLEWQPSPWNPQ